MASIQKALNNADFSILLREANRGTSAGFPTKVVESMSCGTPVITTRTSDLASYIENGENGFFVENEDIESLASEFMLIFSLGQETIQRIKESCNAREDFLPAQFIDGFGEFINEIINVNEANN